DQLRRLIYERRLLPLHNTNLTLQRSLAQKPRKSARRQPQQEIVAVQPPPKKRAPPDWRTLQQVIANKQRDQDSVRLQCHRFLPQKVAVDLRPYGGDAHGVNLAP